MVTALDVLMLTPGPRGRIGLPAIYWGPPGCGKTSMIEQGALRRGLPIETIILSIREPADIAGLPVVTSDGVRLEPPAWAKRLSNYERGVAFFDELSTATPAVQAAALRVIAEGVVGDLHLPPAVRILAAANPEDQAAGGWALAMPLANRLIHLEAEPPTVEAWTNWLTGDGKIDDRTLPDFDKVIWDHTWAKARTSWAAFIRRFPHHLTVIPKTEAEGGRAFPTPRSHELAARAYAGCKALGAPDGVLLKLLVGAVGEGVATEAYNYFNALDLPDPEDVIAGTAHVPFKRADQTYASLAGVCAVAILPHRNQGERITRAIEVAAEVASHKHSDVAAACLVSVIKGTDLTALFRGTSTSARLVKAFSGPLQPIAAALRGDA